MSLFTTLSQFFTQRLKPPSTLSITPRVDDNAHTPYYYSHDQDPATVLENYTDALTAWRKNPIAWRIIAITSDYVLGDSLRVSSTNRTIRKFITSFWHHPKNRMDNRLESMCDELSRSGDLFVLLFRNPQDGMSYIRFVTKDRIINIDTAPNDYETELAYHERQELAEPIIWLSPFHPDAANASAVMLHYSINKPLGALLGESDLTSMLPWLMRYSRMLEDRVRLHWAIRSFLWMVTVPTNKILEKKQQYSQPPEAGSIIVKDEAEDWKAVTPNLNAADAQSDLKAVRGMIDAGSGYPPHWRGESADANLATATAMQTPTEKHLTRRQKYFTFILQDILFNALVRSNVSASINRSILSADYDSIFTVHAQSISRQDNEQLARAALALSTTYKTIVESILISKTPMLSRRLISLVFKSAGDPLPDDILDTILKEVNPDEQSIQSDPANIR